MGKIIATCGHEVDTFDNLKHIMINEANGDKVFLSVCLECFDLYKKECGAIEQSEIIDSPPKNDGDLPQENDWDKIMSFFNSMGIPYSHFTRKRIKINHIGDEPKESKYILTISQTHFCFNKNKNFIGILGNENGYFDKRIKLINKDKK